MNSKEKYDANTLAWRKAKDIFAGEDFFVFQGDIEPNDVKQGSLGDCYFLSALSVLSEEKEHHLVDRLFHTKEKNIEGLYAVWFCIDGVWQLITVDDQFVCSDDQAGPIFSKSNGNELWVLIMEKCYAKIFGCFEDIESGWPEKAIHDLTGAPYEGMGVEDPEKLFAFLTAAEN